MPRPKGSKNKKKAATVNVDYATQISEKQAAKADLIQQIESKTEELAALKSPSVPPQLKRQFGPFIKRFPRCCWAPEPY